MEGNEANPNLALPSAAASAGAASGPLTGAEKMRKLEAVLARFDITIAEANDLVVLEDYKLVVIADDSESMSMSDVPPSKRVLGQKAPSRWDELKSSISEIVEIASCFDDSGVDLFFLNRKPVSAVRHATDEEFVKAFMDPPSGKTPLTETLTLVADRTASQPSERPVLLFIFTDGVPNGGADQFKRTLRGLLQGGSDRKLRIQIMACTAEEADIGWLEVLDRQMGEIDVTCAYETERAQVMRVGKVPKFTRGDWCMKAMLGPVSAKFDTWDERPASPSAECQCVCS